MREHWVNRLHQHLKIACLANHRQPNLRDHNLREVARIETVLFKRYPVSR